MLKETQSIVNKIISQAKQGAVVIDGGEIGPIKYNLKLNFRINGKVEYINEDFPIVDIPNYQSFIKLCDSYIDKASEFFKADQSHFLLENREFKEKLFADLLLSLTFNDLDSISKYIKNKMLTLNDNIKEGTFNVLNINDEVLKCKIFKAHSNIEGTYKFLPYLQGDNGAVHYLPAVTFATRDKTVDVFAVKNSPPKMNEEQKELNKPLDKKYDRFLRKINKNVPETSDIAKINPPAVVSFITFTSFLRDIGYTNFKAKLCSPIRYWGSVDNKANETQEKKDILERSLNNSINNFMNLFYRYQFHFPLSIADYDDITEEMRMVIKNQKQPTDTSLASYISCMIDVSEYNKKLKENSKNL